VVSRPSTTRKR